MTDRRGDNVWRTPGSPAEAREPDQRWPGRPESQPPPRAYDLGPRSPGGQRSAASNGRPRGPSDPGQEAGGQGLVLWSVLAVSALLLLLGAFARWERPTESPPTGSPATVSVAVEPTNEARHVS
jgi:hypothetical protein